MMGLRKSRKSKGDQPQQWVCLRNSQVSILSPHPLEQIEAIKVKLQANWKNVFRHLNAQDYHDTGVISKKLFEDSLLQNALYLTAEDLRCLVASFGDQ